MLHVFYIYDVKLNWDVAYVAIAIHVYCKCMFQMCHLFFIRMFQVCLFGCCICFIHMLQVFYLDVAYVLQCFSGGFASVSDTCLKCFICMLQVLHLDVSNVDRLLHPLLTLIVVSSVAGLISTATSAAAAAAGSHKSSVLAVKLSYKQPNGQLRPPQLWSVVVCFYSAVVNGWNAKSVWSMLTI